MGSHTDSHQFAPFFNDLLVMKNNHYQQFMPNLCYIVYIDLFIMAFGLQTTINDSCLIHTSLYLIKNDGQVVGSPLILYY